MLVVVIISVKKENKFNNLKSIIKYGLFYKNKKIIVTLPISMVDYMN